MVRLIPRDESFFELFEDIAGNVHDASIGLVDLLEKFDDLPARAKRIKDLEHRGDSLTHDTIRRLNTTFLTPIDREDIHLLATRLDDVVDLIDTAVNKIILYKIPGISPELIAMAHCLKHSTALLLEIMPLLSNMKNSNAIIEKCVAIHTQENEADRIVQHAIADLFEGGDAVHIIKWKDVYSEIEYAIDRCEDVANVIQGIVLKNA